ncbi:MAG: Rne/Rng family ribonuclease [Spirulinaceae cyanobacterium SM2_1_0]|nr:Rne/Rng family ribonuclease [Spirulinaceae cyanobacterium SM2_1_0]
MPKQIIISEQEQIAAVFSEDQIQELVVSTGTQQVGDIYLGTVENVIPGIDAAFVNIGDSERNGFMHVTDLGPLRLRRSAGAITELLAPQQTVLVQVMKEPTGNKGPRLTGNVSLPGRYLVLMPYGRGVNLSRRIVKDNERSRLRALAVLIKPAGMGILVRTEAEGKDEDAIMEDLEYLQKQWEAVQIQANAATSRAPTLLNRDDDFIQRVLRDIYSAEVNRIVVDAPAGVKRVKQQLMNWSGGRAPEGVLIDQHRDRLPILEFFRVNAAIREALKPRVDLPSGGYIIIEQTEALTVVDVNSGSFTRSNTSRETVLWTNYEAATEIARQLRLRNIAGVIVVDFIDMDSRRDQLALLEHFTRYLRADKARPQIAQLSELGLVELTRKRQGKNLRELFGDPCPHCGGLGHLVRLPGEAPQVLSERVIPAVASMPSTARTPEIRLSLPDRDVATELDDEDSDLDLLHHPSYQEPSGGNNRRRRRRRIGDLDGAGRSSGKGRPQPTNGQRASDEDEDEAVAAEERGERSERSERSERGERRERRERREIAPLERIAVEMTPIEQEIYALMGVSPLLRLEREVKDPRAVVLSIHEPGTVPSELEMVSGPMTSEPTITAALKLAKVAETVTAEVIEEEDEAADLSEMMSAIAEPEVSENLPTPTSTPVAAIAAENEAEPASSGKVVARRRRRRSSAREA